MAMGEGTESYAGEDSAAAVGAGAAAALLGRARRGRRDVRAGAAPPPRAAVPKQLAATAGHRRRATGQGQGARAGAGRARVGGRWGERGLRREERRNKELGLKSMEGKKTLAGAEAKSVDCRRFGDPIDEPNALRQSPRRDERSGTLGFGRRCTY
jgi:hypothetical protein